MNFQKKMSYAKKSKIRKKKPLSDPPKRIVVEMVGGSDRPEWSLGPKGLQAVLPF